MMGLVVNMVGMGLGPVVTGALSDSLAARFGASSLRYALMPAVGSYLICAFAFWMAARAMRRVQGSVQ